MTDKELLNEIDQRIEFSDDNFLNFVKEQLETLNEDDMQNLMNKNLLRMCYIFSMEDYSGFSADIAINLLNRLLNWKPVVEITEDDNQWNKVATDSEQNKYCPSVFRNKDEEGNYHYIDQDKYAFTEDDGGTWFSCNPKMYGLSDNITLPYYPPVKPSKVYIKNGEVEKIVEY